jgi:hypothetical protein
MKTAVGLLTLAVAAVRWARRTGTTAAERSRALPGDQLVPDARLVLDRATTLPAPAERVWPWLVQLGKGRGGWYLPRSLELLVPPARRGLRRIDPRWQRLAVGEVIPDWGGAGATFEVVTLDPPHALVHRSRRPRRGGPPMEISWALVLDPLDGDRCRLQLRLRIDRVGRRAPALVATAADLVDGATVRPLFAGLAERVSRPS